MNRQFSFEFWGSNPDEPLPGWEKLTVYEQVQKQPEFVGYDQDNNFVVDFRIINRHNVELVKRFIFDQNGRLRTKVIEAEGPVSVNIIDNFDIYTEISRRGFQILSKRARAIYQERARRSQIKDDNPDQLKLDF
ncbi:MAG: hypothetical protein NZ866_00955 [Patescibacteria group bacterium]|nr:hypothetical protein [Patescibacteria group bacterium]